MGRGALGVQTVDGRLAVVGLARLVHVGGGQHEARVAATVPLHLHRVSLRADRGAGLMRTGRRDGKTRIKWRKKSVVNREKQSD